MSSGWNTIDSDAGVFTRLVEKLQVKGVQFDDLFSIDKESLQQSDPVYGVVFLFKYSNIDRNYANDGNKPMMGEYDMDYQDKGIFFANQTIQNSCATQAVLNVLLNKTDEVEIGSDLSNFKSFVEGFDGEMIGETITNSDTIRQVHNSFSTPSMIVDEDPEKPPSNYNDKNDGLFHFIGFIMKSGFIYELDGLKNYPIRHVPCDTIDDFYDKLPQVLMERVSHYNNELRFSSLVITNNKLIQAQDTGDYHLLNQELEKREVWDRENELRQYDYTNLLIKIIKNISKESNDEEWNKIIQDAKLKSQSYIARQYYS